MSTLDWAIVVAFLVTMLVAGAVMSRRAKGSISDFFVSGRNLPWWLAGTSSLATSFACDTPLHVTKLIREQGLPGLWLFWSGLLFAGMLPFLFARLWRRAGILTDCELIELRYSGRVAAYLRAFMALFRTFCIAAITLGWVVLGMVKIVRAIVDLPAMIEVLPGVAVPGEICLTVVLVAIAVVYTAASGLWGVVATDAVEFVIAMGGAVVLAVIAVDRVGGVSAMKDALVNSPVAAGNAVDFVPSGNGGLPIGSFIVYLLVLGWAHAEADGGGNKAQRYLACKNEGHALASGIWALAVQNMIRSWPWYVAALASIILYPTLTDHEMAYPMMIADLLPSGVKGLLIASFFAAFFSTIDTHLNLSASYLVNDLYRRFVRKDASEKHYVLASRLAVILMAGIVTVVALQMTSILDALKFKGELMAGFGLAVVLRWYWWRINAWSEIAAMTSSVVCSIVLRTTGIGVKPLAAFMGIDPVHGDLFPARILIIVAVSVVATLVVTLVTRPVDRKKLVAFYEKVKPGGLWNLPEIESGSRVSVLPNVLNWLLCSLFIAASMFCVGKLVLGFPYQATALLALAVVSGFVLLRRVLKGDGNATSP